MSDDRKSTITCTAADFVDLVAQLHDAGVMFHAERSGQWWIIYLD